MRKILYIDMDGVVADFVAGIKHYSGKDIVPGTNANHDWVYDVCRENPNIFLHLNPIPGSIDAVKELFNYYEVYFLSVPMYEVPQSFTDKYLWLQKHFGELAKWRLMLVPRKDLNTGHFLVDDRLMHGVDKFTGIHIHYGTPDYPDWETTLKHLKAHA